MRLVEVQVERFRNFTHAQAIEIEPDVTGLVGKNESGKTTVLKALHRLKPANGADRKFHLTTEYPRWRLARDRRDDEDLETNVHPIRAVFALEADDLATMSEVLDVDVPLETQIHAWRAYDDSHGLSLECPLTAILRAAGASVDLSEEDIATLAGADSYAAARELAKSEAKRLKEDGEALRSKAMTAAEKAITKHAAAVEVDTETEKRLWDLLPSFFYFSAYNILPGETDLTELSHKVAAGTDLEEGERSVVALLAHAGEKPADFMDADYDSRKAELQAASTELSQRVFEYWRQNDDLDVVFDTDNIMVADRGGIQAPHRILKIELRDARHGNVETNFSTRSTGFQWFFSFFAAFSEYQSSSDSIIVLLDEPGTSLHGDAQRDFVRFIFEELGAKKQVLYTTHSQHMIDPTKYEKLRAVHDRATRKEPGLGVAVTPINLSADRSTILPVESALGYTVSQHLFLGSGQHLTVEGSSDFVYLQRVTEHLIAQGQAESGLSPKLAIIPVGGIDNMPAFVALLGRRLEVSALVDGDRSNFKLARIKAAAEHNGVAQSRIVVCADVTQMTNSDIEDLFDVDDYLRLYNWAFSTALKPADLAATNQPVIKRITDLSGEFDHALPAHALTNHREEFFASVKPKSLEQFKLLFERLNATVL